MSAAFARHKKLYIKKLSVASLRLVIIAVDGQSTAAAPSDRPLPHPFDNCLFACLSGRVAKWLSESEAHKTHLMYKNCLIET